MNFFLSHRKLAIFIFLGIGLNLTAVFAQSHTSKKHKSQIFEQDSVLYPPTIFLSILPVEFQGTQEKQYLSVVLESLFSDQLSIQRNVWLKNITPAQVIYRQNNPTEEDSYRRNSFVQSGLFPLRIRKVQTSETDGEDFFLKLSLKENNEKKISLQVSLLRLQQQLFKDEIILQENNLLTQTSRLSENIRGILSGNFKGNLQVESLPVGASVYVDNFYLGKTPFHLNNIAQGEYHLVVRKQNYLAFSQNINITAGEENKYNANLQEESGPGLLSIISNPAEAKIYLDHEFIGISPLLIKNIPFGFHRLMLKKEGHQDYTQDIEIKIDKNNYQIHPTLLNLNSKNINLAVLAKRNLNASKALFILSAAFAVSGVAMLVEHDVRLQREYRNLYAPNSDEWQKNQHQLKTFEALSLGFFLTAGGLLIGGGVLYVNYLKLLSNRFSYAGKNFTTSPRLSFSLADHVSFAMVMNY